jgi:hypothetical protein
MNFDPVTNNSDNAVVNMSLNQGEDVAKAMTLKTGSPLALMNLTGYSFKMQINFATPLVLSTSNSGITIPDPVNGLIQVNIASATTKTRPSVTTSYDFWMTSPGGQETFLWRGVCTVTPTQTTLP